MSYIFLRFVCFCWDLAGKVFTVVTLENWRFRRLEKQALSAEMKVLQDRERQLEDERRSIGKEILAISNKVLSTNDDFPPDFFQKVSRRVQIVDDLDRVKREIRNKVTHAKS